MIFLLDTNAVSDLMRAHTRIENWISGLDADDLVVTCTIVRGETLFGIARLPEGRRRSELEETCGEVFSAMSCEPITERAADFYASVKLSRQQKGLALDENDLWIAATALALGATLVSRDRDFAGIRGLSVIAL